jgi:hypothetical protein
VTPEFSEQRFFIRHAGRLAATPLLAALVVVDTFAHGDKLVVDARAGGLLAAGAALAARLPILAVVALAAVVTAALRAVT